MKEIIKANDLGGYPDDKDSMGLEIELMIMDCSDIINAIYVYKDLIDPSKMGNHLLFSIYFSTLENAIIYRIIMGIARLFDMHADSRSVKKIINILGQEKPQIADLKVILDDLDLFLVSVNEKYNIRELRDRYFAHLDKKMRFSSIRIDSCINCIEELEMIINNLIEKLVSIYTIYIGVTPTCYNEKKGTEIEIPKLEKIKDIHVRASKFLKEMDFFRDRLYVDEDGLHFKEWTHNI